MPASAPPGSGSRRSPRTGAPSRSGSPASSAGSRWRTWRATATRSGSRRRAACRRRFLAPIDGCAERPARALGAAPRPVPGRPSRRRAGACRVARRRGGARAAARRRDAAARRVPARRRGARVVPPGGPAPAAPPLAGRLRREIEPVEPSALARFLPRWQGVGGGAGGIDRLAEVIAQLEGMPLPASVLERDVLPARVAGYSPRLLDELGAAGEVVWIGLGSLGRDDGRVALYRPDRLPLLLDAASTPARPPTAQLAPRRDPRRISPSAAPRSIATCSLPRCELAQSAASGRSASASCWTRCGTWSGRREVTNDTFAPLRALRWPRTGPSRRNGPTSAASAAVRLDGSDGPARGGRSLVAGQRCRRHGGGPARRSADRHGAPPRAGAAPARRVRRGHARHGRRGGRWPAASRPSIRCCARWRSAAGSGAATSSRVSAARSSASLRRSTGCAPSAPTRAATATRPRQ